MANILNFYLDDSGTRCPDRQNTQNTASKDWFSLGGVLIRESDEADARQKYDSFCELWDITSPLHSNEIRHKSGRFQWLRRLSEKEHNKFLGSLERLLLGIPVIGLACVIDRPGYNHRYKPLYGRRRWSLCKTAFSIAVERAAKFAAIQGLKLRVLPERCTAKDDRKLKEYYDGLKSGAAPFDQERSRKYFPLTAKDYREILYEFRPKNKTSPLMQVADLYLWPMCMGGYDKTNRPFLALIGNGRLMDCVCGSEEKLYLGIKYSCFDLVTPRT